MEFKSSIYISDRDRIERALQIFLDLEETFKPILDNINELLDLPNLISQFDPDTVALLKDIAENLEEIIKVSTVEFGVDDGYLSWRFATDPDWTPIISMDELKGDEGTGIEIAGSVDEYADLPDDLGIEDAGKLYLVKDNGLFYVWDGTSFPSESDGIDLQGPPGTTLFSELEDDPKDNALLSDYLDGKADVLNYEITKDLEPVSSGTGSQPLIILLGRWDQDVALQGTLYGLVAHFDVRSNIVINFNLLNSISGSATVRRINIEADATNGYFHVYARRVEYEGNEYIGIELSGTSANWYPYRFAFRGRTRNSNYVLEAVNLSQVTVNGDYDAVYSTSGATRTVWGNQRYNGHVDATGFNITANDFISGEHRLTNKADKLQTYENRSSNYTITDAETHDVDRITGNNDVTVTLTTDPPSGFWRVIRQRDEGRAILNPTSGTQIRGATETTGPDSSLLLMRVGQMTWEVYGG